MRNDFTRGLLNYSAERDDCIARPERWDSPPPLVVSTPLFEDIEEFADHIWDGLPRPTWYFLIGGPGNGKSEAVARFVQTINRRANKAGLPMIFDSKKGQHGGSISYWFHEQVNSSEVAVLQDISVPRNAGSDPAADLLASLELCLESGAHLLACANRGMLLRATRKARATAGSEWLASILDRIDEQTQDGASVEGARHLVTQSGKQVDIRVWPLDHESVLFGNGGENPWADPQGSLVDQIIVKAVAEDNWEKKACSECPARELCPLLGDARWLRDSDRRHAVLKILRNAEMWSGQHMVLREALGFVSLVLVGCPSDFVEGGVELHPCEWVQRRAPGNPAKPKDQQALLELLSHRVYQDLFGRAAPTGLALDRAHQWRDANIVERLESLGSLGSIVARAIKRIDRAFAKQAGPLRLIGNEGILQSFDPARDSAWCSTHSISPEGQISDLRKTCASSQGQLEEHLGDLLQLLEDEARLLAPHKDPARTFAALYRWASTLYLRLAGTALGETSNAESLGDYLALLHNPLHPIGILGKETALRELMKAAAGSDTRLRVAPSFTAEFPSLQLKPIGARRRNSDPRWPANDRLALEVFAAGSVAGPTVLLPATVFLDTWRKEILDVAEWNISPAMENLMHAWRDDFMVSKGQFRNLQAVAFQGKPPLEFEFLDNSAIQVRPRKS